MATLSKSYLRSQLSVNNSALNEEYGLIIYPPTVEFLNVRCNQSSTAIISIQNATKTLKKIRVIGVLAQHKKLFTVHTTTDYQILAAGCSMDITLTFNSKQALTQSIFTELSIGVKDRMVDGHFSIETVAKIPSSNIEFESMLDFGTMIGKECKSKTLKLRNLGQKSGFYEFEIPSKYKNLISIKPHSKGELEVNKSQNLQISLIAPTKLGIFRCLLSLKEDETKTVELICNICEHQINFLMTDESKRSVQQINFGHLYFGQRRSFKGLLVNNGPKTAHYSIYLRPNKHKKKQNDDLSNTHYATKKEESTDTQSLDEQSAKEQDLEGEFDEDAQPISIDYEEGTLEPYEHKMITVSYIPELPQKQKGFSTTYCAKDDIVKMRLLLMIECKQLQTETMQIPLNGIAFPVLFCILPSHSFDFGECQVYDRRDLYVELKNNNEVMSMHYAFEKIACFNASPCNGTLCPLQSVEILLSFVPKQLGAFKNTKMKITFNHLQSQSCFLYLSALSKQQIGTKNTTKLVGGTDTLPIDFKPMIKIVKNKQITAVMKEMNALQFTTERPMEKSAFYKPEWNKSTCVGTIKKEENISIINASSVDNLDANLVYTHNNEQLLTRYQNKQSANMHLVKMRKKRKKRKKLQSKVSLKSNQNHVNVAEAEEDEEPQSNIHRDEIDIGLNAFYGLNEPNMALPIVANEDANKLYLGDGQVINGQSDRLNFFKKCQMTKYKKQGSICKMDENKLIVSKFKEAPETNMEIIDCQSTLTRKDLKSLQFGPKVMDFGKKCIHSETKKNFGIVNTLKQTILVECKANNDEFIQIFPLSQVIPSQHMAGFDVVFNAKQTQMFEEDFIFLINGIHTISFKVKAEIISMDLSLSCDKLMFEFPSMGYLDFHLSQSITLKNTLTAPTKFRFDTESIKNKEISIKPCSGTINANKSANILCIWSPASLRSKNNLKESEHVKLRIIDGMDKVIQIETFLPLAKCTLSNKCIDFGAIAIGTEHTQRVQLKNAGHIQSVFRVIRLPKNVSIHPMFGKVDVGSSTPLSITYLSCNASVFNENVIIEVRGGKTLKLNVTAQSVIPLVDIKQNEFKFGGVTIGDSKSLKICLSNASSVGAHLFIELTANEIYPNGTFDIEYPNEWNDAAIEPTKVPIMPLPPIDEDEMHSFIAPTIAKTAESVNRSSRTSLSSKYGETSVPSSYIRIVRSMDNPNLLSNDNAKSKQSHSSQSSLSINTKATKSASLATNRSRKTLSSPMMRRSSLLAMGQHLDMMNVDNESEESAKEQHAQQQQSQHKIITIAEDESEERDEIRYRILIPSNSTLTFKLIFCPKEIANYDFSLNLSMAGMQCSDEQNIALKKRMIGNGMKPRIALSSRNVSFFDVTVLSQSKAKSHPYQKQIILTNEEANDIEFKFKIEDNLHHSHSNDVSNLPWKIVPNFGVIKALKKCKICIYFSPSTDQLFRDNVSLLLSTNDEELGLSPYLSLGFEGQASFPKLSFNSEFLLLPSVPLQCRSSKRFLIRNHGYENLEIRYEIIDDKAAQFIKLSFPNGRIIGGNGPNELKVEVSFCWHLCVAFTTRIDFLDSENNRFSIFVSGMTDNCILSNQPFLYHNECLIAVHDNSKSVVSKLQLKGKKSRKKRDNVLIPDDIPINILCDVSVLIRYLEANCYLKFDSNIDNFPSDLVASNGKMVFDLVQFLSGKKIPGLKTKKEKRSTANTNRSKQQQQKSENSLNKQAEIERLIHDYAQLINFLKAHGAFITMRPEHCLSCTQYIKFIQMSATMSSQPPSSANEAGFNELKSSKSQSDMQKLLRQSERVHPMISYVCWTQILFQIVKLFVLQKITFQKFIKHADIAGMIDKNDSFILKYTSNQRIDGNDINDNDNDSEDIRLCEDRLTKSNVYSLHENILLLWISVHYNKVNYNSAKFVFFENFSHLNDGIAIGFLLKSYAPNMSELERINTRTPLNDAEKHKNATLILQSMKKLGLNMAITADDIIKAVERNLCLLVLYLYQHLAKWKEKNKKNVIEFDGNLNEEIIRKIHISNPSKVSKICYEIVMNGDDQFELKGDSFIVLAPKQSKKTKKSKKSKIAIAATKQQQQKQAKSKSNSRLSTARTHKSAITEMSEFLSSASLEPETDIIISYTPRFVRPSDARLTLLSKPFPDATFPCHVPETLFFKLISSQIQSKPLMTVECEGKLYESTKIDFEVTNPYGQDCDFLIILKNVNKISKNIPSPWHCSKKNIKIRAKQSCKLSIEYLPFTMSKHLCCVTFMDAKYGEFEYRLNGNALLPQSIEDMKLKCKDTQSISHQIDFENAFKNPLLLKARHIAADRIGKDKELRKIAKEQIKTMSLQTDPCTYFVDVSSPFYVAPKQFKIASNSDFNNFVISFNPKGPGSYPCTIKFESKYKEGEDGQFNIGDIRIYNLEILAQSEGTRAELDFVAHCNEKIVQKIPIVNSSDCEWRIGAELNGEAANDFEFDEKQKELLVCANSTAHFSLVYAPKCVKKQSFAQLILSNFVTTEKYIFDLSCKAKEPLATNHFVVECQAKSTTIHEIEIENPYYAKQRGVEYLIESDLPGISGDSQLTIASNQKSAIYKASICPQRGGHIHGSLSFIERHAKQRFVWFGMELICSSPEASKIIQINAFLREVVCVEINLSNPLDVCVDFEVDIDGEGLFGASAMTLEPQQSKVYKLHYSPLITGQQNGSIYFRNDEVGEFWYSLILQGHKAKSIRLKDMMCSVGNVCSQSIKIENPFDCKICLEPNKHFIIDDDKHFFVDYKSAIEIGAHSVFELNFCYRPSLIGIEQSCEFTLKHPKLGEWNYQILGIGKEPNIESPTIIYAALHSRISKVICFQNPFDQVLKIRIDLEAKCDKNEPIFQLFMKRKKEYSVSPNSTLQIPIFFSPICMSKYCANLVIFTTHKQRELIWNYPIIGLAEHKSVSLLNIKCCARSTFHKIWTLKLENYEFDNVEDDFFKICVASLNNDNNDKILSKALNIDLIKSKMDKSQSVQIEILFEPKRAFDGMSSLQIVNKDGVRWQFELNINVNEAAVDDIIKIESQIHCTSSICFGLDLNSFLAEANEDDKAMHFKAYFTADSPFEFDVDPKQGMIEEDEEQQFVISFCPSEYGAALTGKLIIETEIMEWSYRVIGTLPLYIPPNLKQFKATVDDKISAKIQNKRKNQKNMVKNRNFLKKNISATKKQKRKRQK